MAQSTDLEHKLRIIGVYDNYASSNRLVSGWGFSVFLEFSGGKYLFDAGADVAILARNMEELGVEPEEIKGVILSHPHCDHVGGLSALLRRKGDELRVFMTEAFPDSLKRKVVNYDAELVRVSSPQEISAGLLTTGEMDGQYRGMRVPEQSLIVETGEGPIVIAGCAHQGIESAVDRATEITGNSPHLVLGGFHLGGASREKIEEILKKFRKNDVHKVAPSHCTGQRATKAFKREYNDEFIEFGVGKVVTV